MRYLTGEEVLGLLGNIVYQEKQQHAYECDLTVEAIFRVNRGGALDFGGSEYEPAEREMVKPKKISKEDKYGWWELAQGNYILRFNEGIDLKENQIGFVQAHERLILSGGQHPAFHFRGRREKLMTLLSVGADGLRIKENARVTKLMVMETG